MECSPPYAVTLSSRSSSESIPDSTLKTPLDSEQPSPPNTFLPTKAAFPVLPSHLESRSKRANSTPIPPTTYARRRRETNSSMVSISSQSSQVSLLRTTLMLVSSSSKPRSASMRSSSGMGSERTPSLVTSPRRTSVSSLASTALSSPGFSGSATNRPSIDAAGATVSMSTLVDNAPSALLSADATTALSPTSTSPSLAQFSPTAPAMASLKQYGIAHARSKTVSGLPEMRSKRSRARTADGDRTHRNDSQDSMTTPTTTTWTRGASWFSKKTELPSIARAIEPDTPTPTTSMGLDVPHGSGNKLGVPLSSSLSSSADRIVTPGQALAGTPRPEYPIQSSHSVQPPVLDKGKGRVVTAFTSNDTSCGGTTCSLDPTASGEVRNVGATLAIRSRVVARPDSNLPTLEAIESGSRLMRSKIVCATCGDVGPDFPRCGRCREAWCSRPCRVEANRSTGGKHRCSVTVS